MAAVTIPTRQKQILDELIAKLLSNFGYTQDALTFSMADQINAGSQGGGGAGTVTSITAGTGLTGGVIVDAGTIAIDTTVVVDKTTAQTLTTKTLTTPIINGLTSASGNADFSGSVGLFKTTTGAATFGGSSNAFSGPITQTTLAVASTQTAGQTLSNTTAAVVSGQQQNSPAIALFGKGSETSGNTSQTTGWLFDAEPTESTTAKSDLTWYHNSNNSLTERLRMSSGPGNGVHLMQGNSGIELDSTNNAIRFIASPTAYLSFLYNISGWELVMGGGDVFTATGTGVWANTYRTTVGSVLDSTGANITVTMGSGIHHVSGVGSIQTITFPVAGFIGQLVLIPDAIFTTVTGGNIAKATTAVVGKALVMTSDGTNWYPSY